MTRITDHDLLLRIDERQAGMQSQLNSINKKFETVVQSDDDYKRMVAEHKNLWDSKNKMVGWMIGAGMTGGGIATVVGKLVTDVLAFTK